jgi:hypothetical protein
MQTPCRGNLQRRREIFPLISNLFKLSKQHSLAKAPPLPNEDVSHSVSSTMEYNPLGHSPDLSGKRSPHEIRFDAAQQRPPIRRSGVAGRAGEQRQAGRLGWPLFMGSYRRERQFAYQAPLDLHGGDRQPHPFHASGAKIKIKSSQIISLKVLLSTGKMPAGLHFVSFNIPGDPQPIGAI